MADGKGNYGTIHIMEQEMRDAEQGVFEQPKRQRRASAKSVKAPENKGSVAVETKA